MMAEPTWWPLWDAGTLLAAGTVLVWALVLFVGTRGVLRRIPLLAALAMSALVVYLLGQALAALAPSQSLWATWSRRTWWGVAFAPAFWLAVTLALAAAEGPEERQPALQRLYRLGVPVALLLAGLFAIVGTATGLVHRWNAPPVTSHWAIFGSVLTSRVSPAGALFPAYQAFLLLCAGGAALTVAALWWLAPAGSPLRTRFRWLLCSAVTFLVAAGYLSIASIGLGLPVLPGQLLLIAGMAIMGWNVARYGALLAGEVVTGDFLAFSLATLAVVVLYSGVLLLLAPASFSWLERVLLALLLIMASHAIAQRPIGPLDRLLYGRVVGTLRDQLRRLALGVGRQPDPVAALAEVRERVDALVREQGASEPGTPGPGAAPAAPAGFRVLVEGALRHLNDLPALSQHPLLYLLPATAPGEGTPLERAARLRREQEQAIGRLRPSGTGRAPAPGSATGPGGWLHYLVLHEAYVEGRPNKQIMQRYCLSEGTFHRARRRAIDALAADLSQQTAPGARASSRQPL